MDSLTGRLIVAAPDLVDPNFRRSVVLMVDHDDQGAMGLVLNRPGGPQLPQLLQAIPAIQAQCPPLPAEGPTFVGGPVSPEIVTLLHRLDEVEERSPSVVPGVHVAHDLDVLQRVLRLSGASDSPDRIFRLYCGYSGWGAGQIEAEIEGGSWLITEAGRELVFDTPIGFLWGRAISQLGEPYRRFALMPFNPETN